MTRHYLSRREVEQRAGLADGSLRGVQATPPPPDAVIGADSEYPVRGWLPATVDAWLDERKARKDGRVRAGRKPPPD